MQLFDQANETQEGPKLSPRQPTPFVLMITASLVFAAMAVADWTHRRVEQGDPQKSMRVSATPTEVIGDTPTFKGDISSPYTLVEFGDYQCPPCRRENGKIPAILTRYRGKLRFTFRNLPLTNIHPYAMDAAIAAEASRTQGRFWDVHDFLYNENLDFRTLSNIPSALKLNSLLYNKAKTNVAPGIVRVDTEEANRLNFRHTPTFLLCYPDGKVIELESLDQIRDIIL